LLLLLLLLLLAYAIKNWIHLMPAENQFLYKKAQKQKQCRNKPKQNKQKQNQEHHKLIKILQRHCVLLYFRPFPIFDKIWSM
jgi:N-dimethylarginine dimethylaminohydrolase